MNERVSWRDRLKYRFDEIFSRGVGMLILLLAALSAFIVVVAALVISLGQIRPDGQDGSLSFWEAAWEAMMRTLDAGTMGQDSGWGFRLIMFMVTIGGVFIISTLIGVLSNGLSVRIEHLRKGRSRVIEKNHFVILGWTDQIFIILHELALANGNHRGRCAVVLGQEDKVEMEDAIREKVTQPGVKHHMKIVCRTGNPIDTGDLAITNLNDARAIIVLSPDKAEDPDAEVIKTVLAILNASNRRSTHYHIVAELRNPRNFDIAHIVGDGEVEWVLVGDLVARVIAQTCRQSGLSSVYTELLNFEGVEMYFTQQPALVGKTFGEALLAFESNALMGLLHDHEERAELNPPHDTLIGPDDYLVVLAEDDDQITLADPASVEIQTDCIHLKRVSPPAHERTLVLGWNWRGPTVLQALDSYVPAGSSVTVAAGLPGFAAKMADEVTDLANQSLVVREVDTTDGNVLESLHLGGYDHVIVLSYLDGLSGQQADSRTLITLLHLRDLADKNGWHYSITSEMVDVHNRDLADVTRADDFIISDRLVSLLLAQIAEDKHLNTIFSDLFHPAGSEVYIKPVENYVPLGEPVNFYTITEAARRQGEVVIGYRQIAHARDASLSYGVQLNPRKSQMFTFAPGDRIVVLAEN